MSVSFFIQDINNKGSITVEQMFNIGGGNYIQYSYAVDKGSELYDKFIEEKLENFECILLGIEKKSARGFELSYNSTKKCYMVRILALSSDDDYLAAFEYIKKLCSFLGSYEIITDNNEKYTIDNIQSYHFEDNIRHDLAVVYTNLLKSGNGDAYFEFKGIYRSVALNTDFLENVIINAENVVEKFSNFVTGLQYINAYSAKQKFYEDKEGTIFGSYTITETVPTILPFTPCIDYENQEIVREEEVRKWIINLVVINGSPEDMSSYENIGQVDYNEFIKRLPKEKYGFIDAKNILIQGLTKQEIENIAY